ncbi:hypothetical protein [Bacillus cereus group sp. RP43]|uniref:hypothetical protein n=1 Tax=Bacillus cereus group sp. RP43 TaxID=3040260 RepID=UPI00339ACF18
MHKYVVTLWTDIITDNEQLSYTKEIEVADKRNLRSSIRTMLQQDFIEIESKTHELILLASKNITEVTVKNKEVVNNG